MKYYVITITTESNGAEIPEIHAYETSKEAISVFHHNIWAKMSNDNVTAVLCKVETSYGGVVREDRWSAEDITD